MMLCVGCVSHAALNSSLNTVSPLPYKTPAAMTCGLSFSLGASDSASVSRYFHDSCAGDGIRRSASASLSTFGFFLRTFCLPSSHSSPSSSSSPSSGSMSTYSFFVRAQPLTDEISTKVVLCSSVANFRCLMTASTSATSALWRSYTMSEQDRTSFRYCLWSVRETIRLTPMACVSSACAPPGGPASERVPTSLFSSSPSSRNLRRSAHSARPT
mmetsp:Transcript_44262/g.117491  ORF Transcript_44262/g.117491 Transcript_44262/m.117491 type:complete len:214 (+) Transcript_44262:794-1435(+)